MCAYKSLTCSTCKPAEIWQRNNLLKKNIIYIPSWLWMRFTWFMLAISLANINILCEAATIAFAPFYHVCCGRNTKYTYKRIRKWKLNEDVLVPYKYTMRTCIGDVHLISIWLLGARTILLILCGYIRFTEVHIHAPAINCNLPASRNFYVL